MDMLIYVKGNMDIVLAVLTTIATVTIAFLAYANYRLSKALKESEEKFKESMLQRDEQFRDELKSLYQAMVIATMVGTSDPARSLSQKLKTFKEFYKGNINIFD